MQHKSWETRKERSLLLSCLITFWSRQEPLEKEHELWIWMDLRTDFTNILIIPYHCLFVFSSFLPGTVLLPHVCCWEFEKVTVSTPQVNIGGRWKKAFEILACLWLGKKPWFLPNLIKSLHVNCPKLILRCCDVTAGGRCIPSSNWRVGETGLPGCASKKTFSLNHAHDVYPWSRWWVRCTQLSLDRWLLKLMKLVWCQAYRNTWVINFEACCQFQIDRPLVFSHWPEKHDIAMWPARITRKAPTTGS